MFSLPCLPEEGRDRGALVGTWCPARVNLPHNLLQYCFKSVLEEEERQGHQPHLQKTLTIRLC